MKKTVKIILAICLLAAFSLCACGGTSDIVLLKKESYFNQFYIKGNKVCVDCNIVLHNQSDKVKKVKLLAHMKEDADNGLLKDTEVNGYDKNENDVFVLPANSKEEYKVNFIGDFAGKEEKRNRNLPEIEIIEVEN